MKDKADVYVDEAEEITALIAADVGLPNYTGRLLGFLDPEEIGKVFVDEDYSVRENVKNLAEIARDSEALPFARIAAMKELNKLAMDSLRLSGQLQQITSEVTSDEDGTRLKMVSMRQVVSQMSNTERMLRNLPPVHETKTIEATVIEPEDTAIGDKNDERTTDEQPPGHDAVGSEPESEPGGSSGDQTPETSGIRDEAGNGGSPGHPEKGPGTGGIGNPSPVDSGDSGRGDPRQRGFGLATGDSPESSEPPDPGAGTREDQPVSDPG